MKEFVKGHELQPVKSRNELLAEMIARGEVPMLPFELDKLKKDFEELAAEQEVNGRLLGEAMQDSSETWHDNAAAEIISASSVGLTTQAKAVVRQLREAVATDYPDANEQQVTLGTLVYLSFAGDEPEPMLITAITTDVPDQYGDHLPEGCEVVTMTSPLGKLLIGAEVDQELSYDVNGRNFSVKVVEMGQPTPPLHDV